MNQPVLEFKNVTWTYEDMDHPALRDVSFTVDRGELVGIIGVNDAGKSTLCRLCNGLIPNSFIGKLTGDVLVNGQSIRDMETAALARSVGSVFSDPEAQMSQVTVLDELYFGPANLNRPKEEILAAAQSVMELLDLAKFRDRSPFQLSGGEQQRVAIASVLTMQPETLRMILDGTAPKGDVFACARIAGIMAAKRTAELIPMCHPIPIESGDIAIEAISETQVRVVSTLRCSHKTGIEMEALTAVSVAALTVYDMCKAVDRGMRIDETLLLHKTGGKSGDYHAEGAAAR